MPDPTNSQIAAAFDELGDLYELDGAIVHRVVAYRNAATAVREASRSVSALAREGRASELAGIGATLQEKIVALLEEGDIPSAVRLRERFPPGVIDLTHLPGLGPKRARRLWEELGVDSLDALRRAADEHRIRDLRGFGAKGEERILAALAEEGAGQARRRIVLDRALTVGTEIVSALREHSGATRVELGGSARRWADSVKDLDVIATADDPASVLSVLVALELVEGVEAAGENGARVRTHNGMTVDLKVVADDQLGNVLQHFTGSKAHNVALREAAVRRGLHVSEYGILDDATGETLRCSTEEEVYARLGYAWIPPELREDRGELEAAALAGGGGLPELVTAEHVRGELHCHTTASDGRDSIAAMADAARARGYEYLAITDHSATHGFGNEVSPGRLREQIERIHAVNAEMDGIEVLAGSEVNILPDGRPDYDDELLAALDWVIASVHTSFGLGEDAMTDRVVAAIEHPYVDAIGHLTGRKIERRPPYPIDVGRVIDAAARTGTMLEINASADRRDLSDPHARAAAAAGVAILVNGDAHSVRTLGRIAFGVATARRAWLEPRDVVNTRPWPEFAALRKRVRASAEAREA